MKKETENKSEESFEYTPKMEKELWAKTKAWNKEWVQAAIDARNERLGIRWEKSRDGMGGALMRMAREAVKQGKKVHISTEELSTKDLEKALRKKQMEKYNRKDDYPKYAKDDCTASDIV